MATQPKNPAGSGTGARLVRDLAQRPAITAALEWFAKERSWINERHLELCRVPAPTFFESARAAYFRDTLAALGWQSSIDRAGNVLATFGDATPETVLSAHLDTVFAPERPEEVFFAPDGRLQGPGTSDNGSGLSALLALARLLSEAPALNALASRLLLVSNVGEEGEGNLSGMRYLCQQLERADRLRAFIVLDGPSTEHVTAQALASRRYEVSFVGPGGHSWNDYGTPNPVHALISGLTAFLDSVGETESARKNSFNIGVIEGGSTVNSIPAHARAKVDLRSEDPSVLDDYAALLAERVEQALERANRNAKSGRLTAKIKDLGNRPGGRLASDSPLLSAIRSVDAFLNIRSRLDCASTDANVPLSLNLPAISIGAGGHGGGAHTRSEWYAPEGRETGLRRILLLLATLHSQLFA